MSANIGQLRGIDTQNLAGELHGAYEEKRGVTEAIPSTARLQHALIESRMMRGQELRFLEQLATFFPHIKKAWLITNVFPGDSVDWGENKILCRWPDQTVFAVYEATI